MDSYPDLHKEVPQVFFKCWDVLVEAEQSFDEYLQLGTMNNIKEQNTA